MVLSKTGVDLGRGVTPSVHKPTGASASDVVRGSGRGNGCAISKPARRDAGRSTDPLVSAGGPGGARHDRASWAIAWCRGRETVGIGERDAGRPEENRRGVGGAAG